MSAARNVFSRQQKTATDQGGGVVRRRVTQPKEDAQLPAEVGLAHVVVDEQLGTRARRS